MLMTQLYEIYLETNETAFTVGSIVAKCYMEKRDSLVSRFFCFLQQFHEVSHKRILNSFLMLTYIFIRFTITDFQFKI